MEILKRRQRLDVRSAAEALGMSVDAIRMRARRGTLGSEPEDGRLHVWVNVDETTDETNVRDALVEELKDLPAVIDTLVVLEEEAKRRQKEEKERQQEERKSGTGYAPKIRSCGFTLRALANLCVVSRLPLAPLMSGFRV